MHYLEWSFKCFVMSISEITHHVISFLCDKLEYVLSTLLPFLFTFLLSRGEKEKQMQQRQVFVFLSRQTVHVRKARVSVSGSK